MERVGDGLGRLFRGLEAYFSIYYLYYSYYYEFIIIIIIKKKNKHFLIIIIIIFLKWLQTAFCTWSDNYSR